MLTGIDSISLSPRNFEVWNEAAKKFVAGNLRAVFIECSFDNTQPDAFLFGHLNPKHLYDELSTLAGRVITMRQEMADDALLQREAENAGVELSREGNASPSKKRKRMSIDNWSGKQKTSESRWQNLPRGRKDDISEEEPAFLRNTDGGVSPKCTASDPDDSPSEISLSQSGETKFDVPKPEDESGTYTVSPSANGSADKTLEDKDVHESSPPLAGLLIVVTHVKDTLEDDVDTPSRVYESLMKLESQRKLGCKFIMAKRGLSIFF